MPKKWSYYNEIDSFAAQWLRNLIAAGHITDGEVDERSIEDVTPDDVKGFRRAHWFAGIGIWDYALNRAGWPEDREVWTGSCPCQPFSVAGKGDGFNDERHLWPAFHWLIEQREPESIFGEQVASKDGYAWLDLVQADLEGTGYTVGSVVAPAAGFGAPHQRHRMYWGAHAANDAGKQRHEVYVQRGREENTEQVGLGGIAGGLADTDGEQLPGHISGSSGKRGSTAGQSGESESCNTVLAGFWSAADWLYCRDEKYRPVEPGTQPLAHGATARVGRLRAYGNAICAPQAEEFIKAFLGVAP